MWSGSPTDCAARAGAKLGRSRADYAPDEYQSNLALVRSGSRTIDSYLRDLDYFHDSEARVAEAFAADSDPLKRHGYEVGVDLNQPGYVRDECVGFVLHPVDLAVNKVLALAGRDEARDVLDMLHFHRSLLPLGPLCWVACGKDPGFTPLSLLELLRRRGRVRPEDLERLDLAVPHFGRPGGVLPRIAGD